MRVRQNKYLKTLTTMISVVMMISVMFPSEIATFIGKSLFAQATMVVGQSGTISAGRPDDEISGVEDTAFEDPPFRISLYRDPKVAMKEKGGLQNIYDVMKRGFPTSNTAGIYFLNSTAYNHISGKPLTIGEANTSNKTLTCLGNAEAINNIVKTTSGVPGTGVYFYDIMKVGFKRYMENWRQRATNPNGARVAWSYILRQESVGKYNIEGRMNQVFNPNNFDYNNTASWSLDQNMEACARYVDMLMTLYNLASGQTKEAWGQAIDDYVKGNNLQQAPVCVEIEPAALMVFNQYTNPTYTILPVIDFFEFNAGFEKQFSPADEPWWSTPTLYNDIKGNSYSQLLRAAQKSKALTPNFHRISDYFMRKNGFSFGATAFSNGVIKTASASNVYWDKSYDTVTTDYLNIIKLTNPAGGSFQYGYMLSSGPTPLPEPSFGIALNVLPDGLVIESKTLGVAAGLALTSNIPAAEYGNWESVLANARAANLKFDVTVNYKRTSNDVTDAIGIDPNPATFTWSADEMKEFVYGRKTIGTFDKGTIGVETTGHEKIKFEYTADIDIKCDGREYKGTAKDDITFTVKEPKPELPPKKGYTSKPEAYSELKNYGKGSTMTGTLNEEYEAMAGIPSTEQLYFAAGGSEFIVDIGVEFTDDEVAKRTYHSYFEKTDSEFKDGDTAKAVSFPSPKGGSGNVTWDPHKGGDFTITWTGSVPNKASAVTVNGYGSVTATCTAQPDRTAYNEALAEAQSYASTVNSTTFSWTAASDKQTRSKSNWGASVNPSVTDPVTTTASNKAYHIESSTDSSGKTTSWNVPDPCSATASPSGPGSYTITVKWSIPAHIICGPDCCNVLPEIHDTWAQTWTYDSMKIASVHLWKLDQGAVNGLENIISTDVVGAKIVQGKPNVFYNIALKNDANYTKQDGIGGATKTSKVGRVRYDVDAEQHDEVVYNNGPRTNHSDGLGKTYPCNVLAGGGNGHNESYADGMIYDAFKPSATPTGASKEEGQKNYPTNKVGFLKDNTDSKDKLSKEYETFLKQRETTVTPTMITDFLILQTSNGDQAVMYFHKTSDQSATAEAELPKLDVKEEDMWDNNINSAAKWKEDHINVGSYNGQYSLPAQKFVWENRGNVARTFFDPDPAGTIQRPTRPNRNCMLYAGGLNMIMTNTNKAYNTGKAEVFWANELHWIDKTSERYKDEDPLKDAPYPTDVVEGKVTGYQFGSYGGSTSYTDVGLYDLNNRMEALTGTKQVGGMAETSAAGQGVKGPYVSMTAGKYMIEFYGEGLENGLPEVVDESNGINLTSSIIYNDKTSTHVSFTIQLDNTYPTIEFRWKSINDNKMIITTTKVGKLTTVAKATTAGYVIDAPYSKEHLKTNDIIIHNPVSTENLSLVPLSNDRDQRTGEILGAEAMKNDINNSKVCPRDPALCDFRVLNCTYFKDTLIGDFDFDTVDEDGNPVNKATGNYLSLPSGFSVKSGMTANGLRCKGTRVSIPFSELKLSYQPSNKIRVEADIQMNEPSSSGAMIYAFNQYALYIPEGQQYATLTTGNGWERKITTPIADGNKHHIVVEFGFSSVDSAKVSVDGVEGYQRINTSVALTSKIIGDSFYIGCWGTNNNYPADFMIDNLKITRLAGVEHHTDDCYQMVMVHPNGLNAHKHDESCLNSIATPKVNTSKNFNYTGGVQTFIAPVDGDYKLEVWGAQGGNAKTEHYKWYNDYHGVFLYYDKSTGYEWTYCSNHPSIYVGEEVGSDTAQGGAGGYSSGTISLKKGDTLSIYVGQQGCYSSSVATGGWNGGGTSNGGASGGGATDIRMGGTELSNRIIVAGGGGGATAFISSSKVFTADGGAGGGKTGGSSNTSGYYDHPSLVSTGGTQTSGGKTGLSGETVGTLGQGGNYTYANAGGAGGGYYGGAPGYNGYSGSGGSGYYGTLTNGKTVSGARTGNGYCTISWTTGGDYSTGIQYILQEVEKGNLNDNDLKEIFGTAYDDIMKNSCGPVIYTWQNWSYSDMQEFKNVSGASLSASSNYLVQTPTDLTPSIEVPVNFVANGVEKIDVTLDNKSASTRAEILWKRQDSDSYTSTKSMRSSMKANTDNQVITFLVRSSAEWKGITNCLQFGFGDNTGDVIIKSIEVYGPGKLLSTASLSEAGKVVWESGVAGNYTVNLNSGLYKFELWGAQGKDVNTDYTGGKGGYSTGMYNLISSGSIYAYVGGEGKFIEGGYNGGGSAESYGGGGGASDIRIGGSALSNRVIVAAGGGGASHISSGGYGGGLTGGASLDGYQIGGTQFSGGTGTASGGSLGQGASASSHGGGGGGGYYGGAAGNGCSFAGGGGSSYVGGVTNGNTISGDSTMPSTTTGTIKGKSGNGYIKITSLINLVTIGDKNGLYGEEVTTKEYKYTKSPQTLTLQAGEYEVEVWGAQGGAGKYGMGGLGGYATGKLTLNGASDIEILVGGQGEGKNVSYWYQSSHNLGGYPGGGNSGYDTDGNDNGINELGGGGGGYSAIKVNGTAVIIGGGGGGRTYSNAPGSRGTAGSGGGSFNQAGSAGELIGSNELAIGGVESANNTIYNATGWYNASYITGGSVKEAQRSGDGLVRIKRLTPDKTSSIVLDESEIKKHWALIPDKLPNGQDNPIWGCSRKNNVHLCDSACKEVKMLVCTEAHHKGMHYDPPNPICWEACCNDENHKNYKPTINTTDGSFTPGNFLNLDYGFKIYYPNIGDFYDGEPYGIGALTSVRGKGFTNSKDTTKWTRLKKVRFEFNVIYQGKLYKAGEWIILGDRGVYTGKAGETYDETKWSNYGTDLYEGIAKNYYDFYCVLANYEAKGASFEAQDESINCPGVNDNQANATNKFRGSFSALHGASNTTYADVVGRIGNLTIEDTGDYRFSNFFKKPLKTNGDSTVTSYGTSTGLNALDGAKKNGAKITFNKANQRAQVSGISVAKASYKIDVIGNNLSSGHLQVAKVELNGVGAQDWSKGGNVQSLASSTTQMSYSLVAPLDGKINITWIADNDSVMEVDNINVTRIGTASDVWLVEGVVREVDESKQNMYMTWVKDIRGLPISKETNYINTYGTIPWASDNLIQAPLSPEKNNIDLLKSEPMLVGYPLYFDISTLGNYWHNNAGEIQVVPYYYALDLNKKEIIPVDVYFKYDKEYKTANIHNLVTPTWDGSVVYNYVISLDWLAEKTRRNYTDMEKSATDYLGNKFIEASDINGTMVERRLDTPMDAKYILGNAQLMRANGKARTFIGGETTYGKLMNLGGANKITVDTATQRMYNTEGRIENYLWWSAAQRWHLKLQLPSSTVFVRAGQKPDTENVKEFNNSNYVILVTADIRAIGDTYVLQYKHDTDNGSINIKMGNGKMSGVIKLPNNIPPVLAVYSTTKSSMYDVDIIKDH